MAENDTPGRVDVSLKERERRLNSSPTSRALGGVEEEQLCTPANSVYAVCMNDY